ncbi:hypothetical protein CBR_g29450 [Chara braunii]|uniref:Uncharacterized protein n=1 Tax=Chara braunii TaxID=69332 RepID=A0A388LAG0_CHABU|nr:hypothetical protein CBR_g29450 [Chara braunii]|eukprot:GBG79300.1 hypothetical protein CBR_g29450 [Chara braunii]
MGPGQSKHGNGTVRDGVYMGMGQSKHGNGTEYTWEWDRVYMGMGQCMHGRGQGGTRKAIRQETEEDKVIGKEAERSVHGNRTEYTLEGDKPICGRGGSGVLATQPVRCTVWCGAPCANH